MCRTECPILCNWMWIHIRFPQKSCNLSPLQLTPQTGRYQHAGWPTRPVRPRARCEGIGGREWRANDGAKVRAGESNKYCCVRRIAVVIGLRAGRGGAASWWTTPARTMQVMAEAAASERRAATIRRPGIVTVEWWWEPEECIDCSGCSQSKSAHRNLLLVVRTYNYVQPEEPKIPYNELIPHERKITTLNHKIFRCPC